MARSRSKELEPPREEAKIPVPDCPLPDEAVLEFIKAIDDYRRSHNRPFPTWTEVLTILHSLGYRRN